LIARRYLEQFALGEKPQCPRARRSSSAREREAAEQNREKIKSRKEAGRGALPQQAETYVGLKLRNGRPTK